MRPSSSMPTRTRSKDQSFTVTMMKWVHTSGTHCGSEQMRMIVSKHVKLLGSKVCYWVSLKYDNKH